MEYVTRSRATWTSLCQRLRTDSDFAKVAAFPLPPLAEQHRIVAKVDVLMDQCDRLDEKSSRREKIIESDLRKQVSVHLLKSGINESEFKKRGGFVVKNFDRLAGDVDQIKNLRQLILDLAVRGEVGRSRIRMTNRRRSCLNRIAKWRKTGKCTEIGLRSRIHPNNS